MLFTEFDQEQYDNHRRKEGEKDTQIKIAKRMKAKGMSITEISELTGLSEEQIEEIKEVLGDILRSCKDTKQLPSMY